MQEPDSIDWNACKKMIGSKNFYQTLVDIYAEVVYQGAQIADEHISLAKQFFKEITVEEIKQRSAAAVSLAVWLADVTSHRDWAQGPSSPTKVVSSPAKVTRPKGTIIVSQGGASVETQAVNDSQAFAMAYAEAPEPQPQPQPVKSPKKKKKAASPLKSKGSASTSQLEKVKIVSNPNMFNLEEYETGPVVAKAKGNIKENSYYIAPAAPARQMSPQYRPLDVHVYSSPKRNREHQSVVDSMMNSKATLNKNNKFHNPDLEAKTAQIQKEFDILAGSKKSFSPEKFRVVGGSTDNFYTIMDDFYSGDIKRHVSPTKRLMQQKEQAWAGKEKISRDVRRSRDYAIVYTTEPGKSYVIEPKEGEINYELAYTNPQKFYNEVMTQKITEHKVYSPRKGSPLKLESKMTTRKIGEVLFTVIAKMSDLMKRQQAGDDEAADHGLVNAALQDPKVQNKIFEYMRQDSIKLVDRNSGEAKFKKQITLIGEKGNRALVESPHEHDDEDGDPEDADLHADDSALRDIKKEVNEYIRKNSKKD